MSKTRGAVDANYVRPGRYLARVDRVEEGENFKKEKFNVVNFTILMSEADPEAFDPEIVDAEGNEAPIDPNRVGETPSWLMMVNNVAFLSSWKGFVKVAGDVTDEQITAQAQAAKTDEDKVWEQTSMEICGHEQPVAGVVLELIVRQILKKESRGKPQDKLARADYYHRTTFRRRVPGSELKTALAADVLAKFYPGDMLDRIIAAEAATPAS